MDVQPQPPPVPSVPADAKSNGRSSRRRSSLPSVPTDIRVKKRALPKNVRTQAASPEVISSLIDSLSAISASTHNHFENLPTSYGEDAAISASVPASPFATSFGAQDGHAPLRNQDYLYPDDACEPPVIRTSKPPSGLSPVTAPKKKDKEHSLRSYIGRSGGSSASLQSAHSGRSASSFGNISIEAGIPRRTSDGSNRTSSESKRSVKAHRSLMYMGSRERLRLNDAERKRSTIQGPEVAASPDKARKPATHLLLAEDTINEEPVTAESSRTSHRHTRRNMSPLRNGVNLLKAQEGGSPKEHGLIPERGSSLRHSGSPSRKGRRSHARSSSRTNRTESYMTNTVPEEDESVAPEVAAKEKVLKELEAEEDEVARRIRELRKQKLLRDKLAGKLPVGGHAGASAVARVSPIASVDSLDPSPTSSVSSLPEKRVQDPAKAHKVLGITAQTMQNAPPEWKGARPSGRKEPGETRHMSKKHGHSRSRSLTVNDGDDATPLPINYRLAVQTLEANAAAPPPPPSSDSASTRTGKTQSSERSPRRTKSMAVGGRSAVGREKTGSIITGPNDVARATRGAPEERSLRSASEDTATRHFSLNMAPSKSLEHRPTLKKKRWSHPDLPAKAERSHNDKVDAINAAVARGVQVRSVPVQQPPHPVIEERPTSADSIDLDVDRYLNAPRLSQKIRHPHTGRVISFSEVGDPQGFAVFVCVGMGLTRYVMSFYDQLAQTLKLRLITPDRPGIGGSQLDPNGTPLSWPGECLHAEHCEQFTNRT
jgi:hypothetical protein